MNVPHLQCSACARLGMHHLTPQAVNIMSSKSASHALACCLQRPASSLYAVVCALPDCRTHTQTLGGTAAALRAALCCCHLQVTSTVKNFYLNQVVEDLLARDFNITDYLPGGITFSDPVFFNDAAVNVSSTTSARREPASRMHLGIPCMAHALS